MFVGPSVRKIVKPLHSFDQMANPNPDPSALSGSPLPCQSLDREGRILDVNDLWCRELMYSREEALGRWFGDFLAPESRSDFPEYLEDFFEDGAVQELQMTLIPKDGRPIHTEFFGRILEEEGGPPRGLCFFRNVTRRREAEAALAERNTFIGTILDNLPIGLAVNYMDEGTATYMNRKFTEIYGWPKEDLADIADFFERVYPDPAYRKEVMDRVVEDMESGDPERMFWENVHITRKDGSRGWVTARNIPIPEQNFMISTVWDVTELHEARRDLEATVTRLRALALHVESVREEEKRAIAREIHDTLGQALTAVGLDLSALRERMDPDPEEAEDFDALQHLMAETLEATQNMSGALRPNALDALGLAAAVEDYLAITTIRTGLECEVESGIPDDLFGKEESLVIYRLIQEAVTNTVRHAGASTLRVRLGRDGPREVLVEVADEGRGITDDEINGARNWGLIGMRERLTALGGSLEISGVPGKGTLVRMRIPVHKQPEA